MKENRGADMVTGKLLQEGETHCGTAPPEAATWFSLTDRLTLASRQISLKAVPIWETTVKCTSF